MEEKPRRAKRNNTELRKYAFVGLIAIALVTIIYVAGYSQGKKQQYFGPNSCRSAFAAIADQLDGAKDATAQAIRGTSGDPSKNGEISKLVNQCLGELPVLKSDLTTTTTSSTTVPGAK